jgi:multidrug efflux pump
VQNIRAAGYLNGKRAVTLIIFRQPGANIIDTVDRIRAQLPSIKASIPQGIDITSCSTAPPPSAPRSRRRADADHLDRPGHLVVFVFLRNGRATLIPSVAVPVSLIGTFAVMYLFGYSLDNLSLMALTISTGFVVDDAIVVMENITRHLEDGMSPFEAALKGAKEIGFTVFSISISLIAVFIPLLLMGGIVGRLFREFAVTLSTAILCLDGDLADHHADDVRLSAEGEQRKSMAALHGQRALLRLGCCRSIAQPALGAGESRPHADVLLLDHRAERRADHQDPQGLLPAAGHRRHGRRRAGAAGRLLPGDERLRSADRRKVIKSDPAVQNVIAFTGGGGATKPASSSSRSSRSTSAKASARGDHQPLRPKLNRCRRLGVPAGAQDLRIGGRGSNALYQYTIQADNVPICRPGGRSCWRDEEAARLPGCELRPAERRPR